MTNFHVKKIKNKYNKARGHARPDPPPTHFLSGLDGAGQLRVLGWKSQPDPP
jgi:hypothetical protein